MRSQRFSTEIGGKEIVAEFTDWTNQTNGSVLLRYGNSVVLATAVMGGESDRDYFPLSVEYEEKFYAAGAILGSRFIRREGRPSDEAVLSGRIVDRTIRPLFPQGFKREVQVVVTVLSIEDYDADILAVNAASLALATSDIPWNGPVSAVRIGLMEGSDEFIINPTYGQRSDELPPKALLDLTVSGRNGLINMIEVGAREVPEEALEKALARASEEIEKIQAWQKKIIAEIGREKQEFEAPQLPENVRALFEQTVAQKLNVLERAGKRELAELKEHWRKSVDETFPETPAALAESYFEEQVDAWVHALALQKNARVDGRTMSEIRPLFAKAGGISPVIHGTGLFYRGETHVLAALTLGGPGDAQLIDTIEFQDKKKSFMLHYNFPPFSVGETGRVGSFNRRMIGHGALAEKSLRPVLPSKDVFPYTIRIVSECLASNGSTSMATVCAGTLSLMDAGVPIVRPVAGIGMGLMSGRGESALGQMSGRIEYNGTTYQILTDIQGPEDHHGDMDLKVAGTSRGITGVQMDVKVEGVPLAILAEAFAQAKKARLEILEVITREIPEPRPNISPRAPEIITMTIRPEQIGLVIGGGGKTINGIREAAGVDDITIEDDGSIFITGKNGTAQKAKEMIGAVIKEYLPGEVYDGEVTRVMDFGAFVRIGPNKDAEGLVHVSEVAPFRIGKISDAVSVGDKVRVMIKEIDEKGRLNLSIKAADPDFAPRKGLRPSENHGGREREKRSGHRLQ